MNHRSTYLNQLQDELVAASRRLHRTRTATSARRARRRPARTVSALLARRPTDVAHAASARSHGLRPIRALTSRPPRVLAATAAATAVGIAALMALSSGSTPDRALAFPVLAKAATDARPMRSALQLFVRHGADLQDAHAITTPYGTGYVAATPDGSQLCVAVPLQPPPARGRGAQYSQSCDQTSEAGQKGLVLTVHGRDAAEFVAVLPTHASDPVVHHADGTTTTLTPQDGVATTIVRDSTAIIVQTPTITYQVGHRAASIRVAPWPWGRRHPTSQYDPPCDETASKVDCHSKS